VVRRPSLRCSTSALRAFEAVARRGTLGGAGDELGVSPSAVTFHLRELQAALGVRLLERRGRGLSLTPEGAELAKDLHPIFAALDVAVGKARLSSGRERIVNVAALPVFAARWLIPRLGAFRAAHPDVDVRLSTSERLVDLAREGYDFAVRSGVGRWPGLAARLLFPQELAPFCSRGYLEARGRPARVSDLAAHSIIVNDSRPAEWELWLEAAGEPNVRLRTSQAYDTREAVLHAVHSGLGIALADASMLTKDLSAGELVRLFPQHVPTDWATYMVWAEAVARTPAADAFQAWLLEEAGRA